MENDTINKLEQGRTLKEKWQGIKDRQRKFVPNFNKQLDMHGNRIPHGKRADATAEYLSQIQWHNSNDTEPKITPPKIITDPIPTKTDKLTTLKLDVLSKR